MTRETTSFVYVTYIRSTPQKVFEAIIKPEIAKRYWGPRERLRMDAGLEMGTYPRQ